MKKNRKHVVEDERTKLIELKSFRFAMIVTMAVSSVICITVLIHTKNLLSIAWPLGIFLIFGISLVIYQSYHASDIAPAIVTSYIFSIDLSTSKPFKRFLAYSFEGLLYGLCTETLIMLSDYFKIWPYDTSTSMDIVLFIVTVIFRGIFMTIFVAAITEWHLRRYKSKLSDIESNNE